MRERRVEAGVVLEREVLGTRALGDAAHASIARLDVARVEAGGDERVAQRLAPVRERRADEREERALVARRRPAARRAA